jgi:hypothetical protein
MRLKICLTTIVLALSSSTIFSQPTTAAAASAAVSNPALLSVAESPPNRSRGRSRIKDRDPVVVLETRSPNEVGPQSVKRGRKGRLSMPQAEPVEGLHVTIGRTRRK